jgi:SAM-dependent methyltransferase
LEGFTQHEKFLVRRQKDIYDEFTAQIFDKIFQPKMTNQYIFDIVEKLTQTDVSKSVLLDAGSGTGELVAYIQKKGYQHVFGIDQSDDMNKIALSKYPDLKLKQGDLDQPMSYDKHTFTHIFMTGSTIYSFQDKEQLFRNLFYWLIPNGYLILQVADREKFDPIPPIGKPVLVDSVQVFVEDRVTDTEIDFIDFKYKSSYDFSKTTENIVIFQETFTDSHSRNVRMNEQIMFMESLDNIIYMAQSVGFIVHGQVNLKEANQDKYQYVFLLERPH